MQTFVVVITDGTQGVCLGFKGMVQTTTFSYACSAHMQPSVHVARLATGRVTRQCPFAKRHDHVQGPRAHTSGPRVLASSSTAGSAEQKIRIKLKAFELPLLKESVSHILQAAESTGQACAGVLNLVESR